MAGNTSGTLGNFFLNAAVGNVGICFVGHNVAELSDQHAFGQCAANGHYMALAQRAGGVFNSAVNVEFRMAGSNGTPLAEFLKFFESIATRQGKNAIEHRRHVTGIKEESVAGNPIWIAGIIN